MIRLPWLSFRERNFGLGRLLFGGAFTAGIFLGSLPASEPVRVEIGPGSLHGSMELPSLPAPYPAVLFIAGSGPTDRDGNSIGATGKNDALKMLALELSGYGIASVRYDKRGVGASKSVVNGNPGQAEADLRFPQLVDDAVAWIEWMRRDRRFSTITLLGHSEGAVIAMLAAIKGRADGVISLAGPGRPFAEIVREQLRERLAGQPLLLADAERINEGLQNGTLVLPVPTELNALFRPTVQPYLISLYKIDPASEAKALEAARIPLLIIQGTTDIQITLADADRLKAANPSARLVKIGGMNHILKEVGPLTKDQFASYGNPSLPLAQGLSSACVDFIKSLQPSPPPASPGKPSS
jgi:hypothetical protein